MSEQGQHEIQRLMPRHFEILNLCLGGYGPKEIAQAVDMTPQAISLITKAPNFQAELARRRASIEKLIDSDMASTPIRAKQKLDEMAVKAAEKVEHLMDNAEDQSLQFKAAQEVLNRTFGTGQNQAKQQVVVLAAGDVQLLFQAAREIGSEIIIPAPMESVNA